MNVYSCRYIDKIRFTLTKSPLVEQYRPYTTFALKGTALHMQEQNLEFAAQVEKPLTLIGVSS